jgi:predicted metalloendopeptidase
MDESRIAAVGLTPIRHILDEIDGAKTKEDLMNVFALLARYQIGSVSFLHRTEQSGQQFQYLSLKARRYRIALQPKLLSA